MMDVVLSWIKGSASLLGWFISSVVIPLTIWFTVLRHDVISLTATQANFRDDVNARLLAVQNQVNAQREQADKYKGELGAKLENINVSIGRVEGQLSRIGR